MAIQSSLFGMLQQDITAGNSIFMLEFVDQADPFQVHSLIAINFLLPSLLLRLLFHSLMVPVVDLMFSLHSLLLFTLTALLVVMLPGWKDQAHLLDGIRGLITVATLFAVALDSLVYLLLSVLQSLALVLLFL